MKSEKYYVVHVKLEDNNTCKLFSKSEGFTKIEKLGLLVVEIFNIMKNDPRVIEVKEEKKDS